MSDQKVKSEKPEVKRLDVLDIGTGVVITESQIKATVSGVSIRADYRVTYECIWWDGNSRRCDWLEAFEIEKSEDKWNVDIGFKSGNK